MGAPKPCSGSRWVEQRIWLARSSLPRAWASATCCGRRSARRGCPRCDGWVTRSRPYAVQYAGIYASVLGPWRRYREWIGFTAWVVRRGGWKYPALFAIGLRWAAVETRPHCIRCSGSRALAGQCGCRDPRRVIGATYEVRLADGTAHTMDVALVARGPDREAATRVNLRRSRRR